MDTTTDVPLRVDYRLAEQIREKVGINPALCYQCRKCTNGCPLTFEMDLYPDQVVRLVVLGQEDAVLQCRTIWVCSSCETCTTRCPNDIDIAGLMDFLKEEAVDRSMVRYDDNWTYAFHKVFLDDIAQWGRVFEAGLLNRYMILSEAWKSKVRDGTIWEEMRLGWALFKRGRLPLRPSRIRGIKEIRSLLGEVASQKSSETS